VSTVEFGDPVSTVHEGGNQRMGRQKRLHAGPLHADAAAMDQPDLGEAARVGSDQVFVDDRADVLRPERVQVERIFDREMYQRRGPASRC